MDPRSVGAWNVGWVAACPPPPDDDDGLDLDEQAELARS